MFLGENKFPLNKRSCIISNYNLKVCWKGGQEMVLIRIIHTKDSQFHAHFLTSTRRCCMLQEMKLKAKRLRSSSTKFVTALNSKAQYIEGKSIGYHRKYDKKWQLRKKWQKNETRNKKRFKRKKRQKNINRKRKKKVRPAWARHGTSPTCIHDARFEW